MGIVLSGAGCGNVLVLASVYQNILLEDFVKETGFSS
jgi:hypothetical protein